MVKADVIDMVISLPSKLFYGTGILAYILILDYEEPPKRDKLLGSEHKKIVTAWNNYEDLERYCQIAEASELRENEFNLNVARHVDISEPGEEVDIQVTIDELKKIEAEKRDLEIQVNANLSKLEKPKKDIDQ